jgi:hypothetical protein
MLMSLLSSKFRNVLTTLTVVFTAGNSTRRYERNFQPSVSFLLDIIRVNINSNNIVFKTAKNNFVLLHVSMLHVSALTKDHNQE